MGRCVVVQGQSEPEEFFCVCSEMFAHLSAGLHCALFLFICICLNMEYIIGILGFVCGSFWVSLFGQTVSIMREVLCACMWAVFKTSRRCNLVSGNGAGKQPQRDLQAFCFSHVWTISCQKCFLLWPTRIMSIRMVLFDGFKLDLIYLMWMQFSHFTLYWCIELIKGLAVKELCLKKYSVKLSNLF